MVRKVYEWIDYLWQWVAERVFVRFDFDIPVDRLNELRKSGKVVFALVNTGLVEFLIISSWSRKNGFGAISAGNRRRMLLLTAPQALFDHIIGNRTYAEIFKTAGPGPLLLFCPTNERKRLYEPTPVEQIFCELYTDKLKHPHEPTFHFVPLNILWRKHVRGEGRKPSEFLFGMGSNPNLIGKLWYLFRQRKDSVVRALDTVSMATTPGTGTGEATDAIADTEAMRLARATRRKILVLIQQEMRVLLGPRYSSPYAVKETILRDPDIQKMIEEVAQTEGVDRKKVMSRAYGNLTEIVSTYKYRAIEIIYALLQWIFTRVFDGVSVDDEQLAQVREVMKTKPIVFIPCHRSHLDYLVVPFLLFQHGMVTPHIAAGINLAFWPVGPFLRRCGAFFIRRSFRGDPLYALCLKKYVEYLLRNRYNIKFFIEGTRSRSGKMLAPAYGLLKTVLQPYQNKTLDDIALFPVSLCYDEVPEQGSYTKELGGGQKVKESTLELLKSRDLIKRNIGKVYVSFAPPLYAKEVLKDAGAAGLDNTLALQKVAFQICKAINNVTPVTAKSIVCSTLLTSMESTLTLEEMLKRCETLGGYAEWAGYKVAAPKDPTYRRAIEQTVRRMVKSGMLSVSEAAVPRLYSFDRKYRVAMNFYKNNGIHCFVIASITVVAFLRTLHDYRATDSTDKFEADFYQSALKLRNLLKFEFFFNPTTQFLAEVKKTVRYLWGDEPWSESLLPAVVENLPRKVGGWGELSVFVRLLGDLLESYTTVLRVMRDTSGSQVEQKAFVQRVLRTGEALHGQQKIYFSESLSLANYTNGILLMENLGFVQVKQDGAKKWLQIPVWSDAMEDVLREFERLLKVVVFSPSETLRRLDFPVSTEPASRRLPSSTTSPS